MGGHLHICITLIPARLGIYWSKRMFTIDCLKLPNVAASETVYTLDRCPEGWVSSQEFCYLLVVNDTIWPGETASCEGGKLASIWSEDEWDFVTNHVVSTGFVVSEMFIIDNEVYVVSKTLLPTMWSVEAWITRVVRNISVIIRDVISKQFVNYILGGQRQVSGHKLA